MKHSAFVNSAEFLQKRAAPERDALSFYSASLLLILVVEIVIRVTDSTWDSTESL